MNRILVVLVGMVALAAAPSTALADITGDWQTSANGCVPHKEAILNDLYLPGDGVEFDSGATGSIVLYCPVSNALAMFNRIEISYRDADGNQQTENWVKAQVYRRLKGSLFPSTLLGEVSSNEFSNTGYAKNEKNIAGHNLDHANHYYWVKITLNRTGSTLEWILGVRLRFVVE